MPRKLISTCTRSGRKRTCSGTSPSCALSAKSLRTPACLSRPRVWGGPTKPRPSEPERTGSRLRMGFSRSRRSFLPATGLSMWRARSRRIRLPRASRLRPGREGPEEACPSRCAKCSAVLLTWGFDVAVRRIAVVAQPLDAPLEHLLRELTPQVLGAVVRRFRDFAAAEDAVQEALLAAATQWQDEGMPDNPRAWLTQVAFRRMTDQIRSESARRRREEEVALEATRAGNAAPEEDDTLVLLFMC